MWKTQWKWLVCLAGGFLICYYLPVGTARFNQAVMESLELVKWYAREHVLLCLVPAFFIAGAIGVFVSRGAVMRYLGQRAKKWIAYLVASVSGTILAVCSCTILPLFAGIYKMGAGLGPASAFLYSGPAINIMAIVLTARVLGIELGIARAVGAIGLSVVIGGCMHLIFRREEQEKARMAADFADTESGRPLWQNVLYIGSMIAILVFANLGKSEDSGVFVDGFLACQMVSDDPCRSRARIHAGSVLRHEMVETGVCCRSGGCVGNPVPGQSVAGVHCGISRSRGIYKHGKREGTPKLV